jgi:hypothetical protein
VDKKLIKTILKAIKNNAVASYELNGTHAYYIGGTARPIYIVTSAYAFTDEFDIWCEYTIIHNYEVIYGILMPMHYDANEDEAAANMLHILKKCSDKIILQEKKAQKSKFLHTLRTSMLEHPR